MGNNNIDLELVHRVQKGDKNAFDTLVLKYQQNIANLVSRFIRDSADVQDVCQESFIKAYLGLASFRSDSTFFTWLYRIAINTAMNRAIYLGRQPAKYSIDVQGSELRKAIPALRDYASPEHELLADEIRSSLHNTLENLSQDLKMAITLREFDGLSYDEIAMILDCPIGTVRSRIFRAREIINANLRPLMNETGEVREYDRQQISSIVRLDRRRVCRQNRPTRANPHRSGVEVALERAPPQTSGNAGEVDRKGFKKSPKQPAFGTRAVT